MTPHLLVFGAGSLVSEIIRSLPGFVGDTQRLRITLATRDSRRAGWSIAVARAHANALCREITIDAVTHDWCSVQMTADLIDAVRPDLILHAASLQSAWSLDAQNQWSRFVSNCGYGVTVPLQLVLAQHVQAAIAASGCRPPWLNACFPDLINACLSLTGLPPLCGIGNVALIAEHMRLFLRSTPDAPLRVIAAHSQLAAFQRERGSTDVLPIAWLGDYRVSVAQLASLPPLAELRDLNAFNAAEASRLIWALLSNHSINTHAPGPIGLQGGYPVRLEDGAVSLDLPQNVSAMEAIASNHACMAQDGAELVDGAVRFVPAAAAALRDDAPTIADGFAPHDAIRAADAMLVLRARWIGQQ